MAAQGEAAGQVAAPSASASDAVTRQAEEVEGYSVCPTKASMAFEWRIVNQLNVPVRMNAVAGSVDCEEWSGESTPARYNNELIFPGKAVNLRLEVAHGFVNMKSYVVEEFSLPSGEVISTLDIAFSRENHQLIFEPRSILAAKVGTTWLSNPDAINDAARYASAPRVALNEIGGPGTGGWVLIGSRTATSLEFICKDQAKCSQTESG